MEKKRKFGKGIEPWTVWVEGWGEDYNH